MKSLESYEKENPYRYGMKKAEVQMTHFKGMKPNVFDKVVELLETEGYVKRVGEFLCTPQFEIKKDETYNKIAKTVLGTFESAKYDFAKYSEIDFGKTQRATADDILNVLLVEGKVVKNRRRYVYTDGIYGRSKEYHSGEISGRSGYYDCSGARYICDQPKECETNFGIYGQYQSYQESRSGK